jgi:hypothetical protein
MRFARFGFGSELDFFMLVGLSVNEDDFPRWGFRSIDDCVVDDGLHARGVVVLDFDDELHD